MIVCPEPPAAEIGGDILSRGGNAADAAVAAAFAQGVANPLMCGLGGTAILMHMDRDGRSHVLNGECETGSGPVPPSWVAALRGRSESIGRFIIDGDDNQVGATSVMTPGFVAACHDLFERFGSGRIAWPQLIEPSIRLAAEGFPVYPYIAESWSREDEGRDLKRPGYPTLHAKLGRDPVARSIYLENGTDPWAAGAILRQPVYAATLDQLARAGADDFYRGEIGRVMADHLARRGSLVTSEDMAGYHVVDQDALSGRFLDWDIWTTPPPSPGVQILEMLSIVERVGAQGWEPNSPRAIDAIGQAMRAGFVDNRDIKAVLLNDSGPWARVVLDDERVAAWANRIARGQRIDGTPESQSVGTTHLVVVDDDGATVSFTHSIGSVAGAGSVTPSLGFLHNNFLGHFDPRPGRRMSILPGRRLGSGAPTIVRKDGRTRLVLGALGGSRIITSIFQVLLLRLAHGMPIDEAVAAGRFHSEEAFLLHLEPGWPEATRAALAALGNTVQWTAYQARIQAIAIDVDGRAHAGADPRGGAVGLGGSKR